MSPPENHNASNTVEKSLGDKEANDDIQGKLLSIVGENKPLHLKEEVGTSKLKEKNEGIVESRKAPGSFSRQISTRHTEAQKKHDDANRNNIVISKDSLGNLSPTPRGSIVDAKNGKINTPTSYLSRDTLTLAQLYQSSRRSRHSPHNKPGNSVIIPPKMVPPPSLSFSVSLDSQQIHHEMNANINNTHEETWSFNNASPICNSCSSNSDSSMESEDFMTREVVTASELFDEEDNTEREHKRRKITPGK